MKCLCSWLPIQTLVILVLILCGFVPASMAQANIQGQWSTLSATMPINPIHVALLNSGKVLVVAGSGNCGPRSVRLSVGPAVWPIEWLRGTAIGSGERTNY